MRPSQPRVLRTGLQAWRRSIPDPLQPSSWKKGSCCQTTQVRQSPPPNYWNVLTALDLSLPDLPTFPTHPVRMDHPIQQAGLPKGPKADLRRLGGPVPAPGTPQDRFAAVLGYANATTGTPVPAPVGPPANFTYSYLPTYTAPPNSTIYKYTQSSGDMPKQGGSSTKGSGKGPARPPAGSPATQWLSYECQRRHFNPDVQVVQQADGTYSCTIVIQNHVVQGDRSFSDPQFAKVDVAAKALSIVQKWPMPSFFRDASVAPPKKAAGMMGVAIPGSRMSPDHLSRQQELRARLLKNKQLQGGEQRIETKKVGSQSISTGFASAEVDMTNPVEARAFVEGYKMGQLAAVRDAQAAAEGLSPHLRGDRFFSESRSRSPSRSTKGDRNYRCRSPIVPTSQPHIKYEQGPAVRSRSYYDGSRHDPSLPSTDSYRPRPPSSPNSGRLN